MESIDVMTEKVEDLTVVNQHTKLEIIDKGHEIKINSTDLKYLISLNLLRTVKVLQMNIMKYDRKDKLIRTYSYYLSYGTYHINITPSYAYMFEYKNVMELYMTEVKR